MTPIPEDVIKILRRPLPPEAIKPHPTKKFLSTIKAIYAVERLNEAFGLNGWKIRNELVELHETTNEETGKVKTMVVMKSFLTVPEYGIEVEAYGGNDNEDRGDAYKGACTDALTKICSYIYVGMDVYKGIKSIASQVISPSPEVISAYNDAQHGGWEGSGSVAAARAMATTRIAELTAGTPPTVQEPPLAPTLKASIEQAQEKKSKGRGPSPKYCQRLEAFEAIKKEIPEAEYYRCLGEAGYEHCNQFPDTARGVQAMDICLADMREIRDMPEVK